MNSRDRELGMDRPIKRRDFLNGVAMAIGAPLLAGKSAFGQQATGNYPPTAAGMRGLYPGSFNTAHSLRDHTFWKNAGAPSDTGERYDLVIVGGGISGLSAAYFYRKVVGPSARILILDVLDDFGGHAKRNEFEVNGRTLLGCDRTAVLVRRGRRFKTLAVSGVEALPVVSGYSLDVTAPGFNAAKVTKISTSVGTIIEQNVTLQPGNENQTITVTAAAVEQVQALASAFAITG